MKLELSRSDLRNHERLYAKLSTLPADQPFVVSLSHDRRPLPDEGGFLDQPMAAPAHEDHDPSLIAGALDTVATLRHPLMSLAVLHLSCPLPLLSGATMSYLASCGLIELKLQDTSIQRSASDGASNLLRSPSYAQPPGQLSLADSIRARGKAMARFARCLPSLRRLSLCNAAFSTADVASLAALTQLEELSLDGAMECGGPEEAAVAALWPRPKLTGVAAADAAYKALLSSLNRLICLRLPLAIAASHLCSSGGVTRRAASSAWDSDDGGHSDDSDDCAEVSDGGSFSTLTAGYLSDTNSGACADVAITMTSHTCGGFSALPNAPGLLPTFGSLTPAPPSKRQPEFAAFSSMGLPDLSASRRSAGDSGNDVDDCATAAVAVASDCSVGAHRMAAPVRHVARACGVTRAARGGSNSGGFSLPSDLQELTIPLCSYNGSLFRAVCEAYGSNMEWPTGDGGGGGCVGSESTRNLEKVSGLRSLHVICAPGYTVWEGSFLNSDRDFSFLSRLGPSLESLHLSLELEAWGRGSLQRSRLAGCFRHLRNLTGLKDLRITGTRSPLCFSMRKTTGGIGVGSSTASPDLLSALLQQHTGPETRVGTSGLPRPGSGGDVRLPPMPRLGAPLPLPLAPRTPGSSFVPLPAPPAPAAPLPPGGLGFGISSVAAPAASALAASSDASPFSSSTSPSSSSPSLDSLLAYWPKLQTLVAGGQRVVRSGGSGGSGSGGVGGGSPVRLVMPSSLEELMAAVDVDRRRTTSIATTTMPTEFLQQQPLTPPPPHQPQQPMAASGSGRRRQLFQA